jgi:hypothetical protein
LDILAPEAADSFRDGFSSVSQSTKKLYTIFETNDFTSVLRTMGLSISPLIRVVTIAMDSSQYESTIIESPNMTMNVVAVLKIKEENNQTIDTNVMDIVLRADQTSRHLVGIFSECILLLNLKNRVQKIANTLLEYYGDESNKHIGASLCSYEYIMTGETAKKNCSIQGQSTFPMNVSSSFFSFDIDITVPKIDSAAPKNIIDSVDAWFKKPISEIYEQILDITKNSVSGVAFCDTDALLCKKQKRSLLEAFLLVEMYVFFGMSLFLVLGINLISISLFIGSQLVIVPAATVYIAYGVPITCAPKLPVCMGDDFFALMLFALPRHISWPSRIVTNVTRNALDKFEWFQVLDADIIDCKTYGFAGFYDSFFWAKERLRNSVLDGVCRFIQWPLISIAPGARARARVWESTSMDAATNECGELNVVGIIPPILLSLVFYFTISFATVPVLRVAAHSALRIMPWLRSIVNFLLDFYNI